MRYDLNGDSEDDIAIEYRLFTWDGVGCSGDGYGGIVVPLNQNEILLNQNEKPLFIRLNDIIYKDVTEPLYWEKDVPPYVVSISNSSLNNYLWPNEWNIQSNYNQYTYYLGLIINKGDVQQLGWIKLSIDRFTGQILIVDKTFTTNGSIEVDR